MCFWYVGGDERRLVREGLRRMGTDGEDKRDILKCLESSASRRDVFRFLANTGILKGL